MIRHKQLVPRFALLAAAGSVLFSLPAVGQIDALRQKDDQFIQALRDQGMSDLLDRFVEVDPPQDPIAQYKLEIALKGFVAEERMERAREMFGRGEVQAGMAQVAESHAAYDAVIAAQKKMIEQFPDDERLPVWETQLVEILLGTYLPLYYNSASWYYEFGLPSPEQKAAFEENVVLALEMSADASRRIDLLANRIGAEPALRQKLEDLGIWFQIQDQYGKKITPFWYAHACHFVALLPDSNPYYKTLGANPRVRGQKLDAKSERDRLREVAVNALRNELLNDDQTRLTAMLISGRALVQKGTVDDAELGVSKFLDPVATEESESYLGYLATLAKAVGRKQSGDMELALDILSGVDRLQYVQKDTSVTSRLIAADLMHRMLMERVDKAQGEQKQQLLAEAYAKPYLPLINDSSGRFSGLLYERWAAQLDDGVDLNTLPPMVRMGVGEQLSQAGGVSTEEMTLIAQQSPSDLAARRDQYEQAKKNLTRAKTFNLSLDNDSVDPDVRARGLFNLGFNHFYLAKLGELFEGKDDIEPYLVVARTWGKIGIEFPDAAQAEEATAHAIGYLQLLGHMANNQGNGVLRPDIRASYLAVADAIFKNWSMNDAAHNNRAYAGAFIYEKNQELDKAVEVYRGCPRQHRDYFQCQTQMMWVLRRQYNTLADEVEFLTSTQPESQDEEAKQLFERTVAGKRDDLDRLRRELLSAAELLRVDAEQQLEREDDPVRTFTAAVALGAARIIEARMLGDQGEIDEALARLEGFEKQFIPTGPYASLIGAQPSPDNARANLSGLVQTALESRIIILVRGEKLGEVSARAKEMMDAFPDAASGVINGVLATLETDIKQFVRTRDQTSLDRVRTDMEKKIASRAKVGVDLGELLVEWAKGRGMQGPQLLQFERALAKSLLNADRPEEAVKVIKPWLEQFPNEPNLALLGGDIFFAAAKKKGRNPGDYNLAQQQYNKIIVAYNARPEKPQIYWLAWYNSMLMLDHLGGEKAKEIPDKIRKLENFDPNLGGELKDELLFLKNKHLAG